MTTYIRHPSLLVGKPAPLALAAHTLHVASVIDVGAIRLRDSMMTVGGARLGGGAASEDQSEDDCTHGVSLVMPEMEPCF